MRSHTSVSSQLVQILGNSGADTYVGKDSLQASLCTGLGLVF